MTTPQQTVQKGDKIITEFQWRILWEKVMDQESINILREIRDSRPHTSTLAETTIGHRIKNQGVTIFASYSALKEHDTAIRKAEREKVLELSCEMYGLLMCIEKENTEDFMDYFVTKMEEFKLRYESLRREP